jgi:hypothetical protein
LSGEITSTVSENRGKPPAAVQISLRPDEKDLRVQAGYIAAYGPFVLEKCHLVLVQPDVQETQDRAAR